MRRNAGSSSRSLITRRGGWHLKRRMKSGKTVTAVPAAPVITPGPVMYPRQPPTWNTLWRSLQRRQPMLPLRRSFQRNCRRNRTRSVTAMRTAVCTSTSTAWHMSIPLIWRHTRKWPRRSSWSPNGSRNKSHSFWRITGKAGSLITCPWENGSTCAMQSARTGGCSTSWNSPTTGQTSPLPS